MTTPVKTRKPYRDIVVIGASTGGVAALMALAKALSCRRCLIPYRP
jgi:chemotaxis response regulator CheB